MNKLPGYFIFLLFLLNLHLAADHNIRELWVIVFFIFPEFHFLFPYYGKCPKISYTKVSDKMAYANSADPDQIAPEGAVWSWSTLFAIPLII